MTTTITITLPIPEGAKTCEGCPCSHLTGFPMVHACYAFLTGKHPTVTSERLPECLAAERVKVGEWWEVRDTQTWGGNFASRGEAAHFREQCGLLIEEARIVHVTRYRRAKG